MFKMRLDYLLALESKKKKKLSKIPEVLSRGLKLPVLLEGHASIWIPIHSL